MLKITFVHWMPSDSLTISMLLAIFDRQNHQQATQRTRQHCDTAERRLLHSDRDSSMSTVSLVSVRLKQPSTTINQFINYLYAYLGLILDRCLQYFNATSETLIHLQRTQHHNFSFFWHAANVEVRYADFVGACVNLKQWGHPFRTKKDKNKRLT